MLVGNNESASPFPERKRAIAKLMYQHGYLYPNGAPTLIINTTIPRSMKAFFSVYYPIYHYLPSPTSHPTSPSTPIISIYIVINSYLVHCQKCHTWIRLFWISLRSKLCALLAMAPSYRSKLRYWKMTQSFGRKREPSPPSHSVPIRGRALTRGWTPTHGIRRVDVTMTS